MGVGIFGIGLNHTDIGCWRLTLNAPANIDLLTSSASGNSVANTSDNADMPTLPIEQWWTKDILHN